MSSRGAECRHYLDAMGIQVWRLRRPLPVPVAPSAPVEAASIPDPAGGEPPIAVIREPVLFPDPAAAGHPDESDPAPGAVAQVEVAEEVSESRQRTARIARLDWDALQTEVSQCTACGLHASRTQTVFGVGDRQADWLIIGEAPGADEDRLGEPFVGRAGKLLDAMLLALGLKREQVYIANILKCRPPQNRDPRPEEARCCWPFLERQIALLKPKIILAVGRIAAQTLLQTDVPVSKLRGRVYRLEDGIPVVVSYHPAYLLRSPREKRKAWEDLQMARKVLAAGPAIPSSRSDVP